MAVNHYFQSGKSIGINTEQNLYEDLIIECMKIYGMDVYYMPRDLVDQDLVLNEDSLARFNHAFMVESYMENVTGFEGEGHLMTKFGLEFRDTATFIIARRRWKQLVGRTGKATLPDRPAEGDVIYLPITKSFFEIRKVEVSDPFFQVGKLYVFRLQCELMQFSSEEFNTDIPEIDSLADAFSLNINSQSIEMENGETLLIETASGESAIVLENFSIENADPIAQNEIFKDKLGDMLDFSEDNPFGDIR